MKQFASMLATVASGVTVSQAIAALANYMALSPAEDAVCAMQLLSGKAGIPKMRLPRLCAWILDRTGTSSRLLRERASWNRTWYVALAESIGPDHDKTDSSIPLSRVVQEIVRPMSEMDDDSRAKWLHYYAWLLPTYQRVALLRILSGDVYLSRGGRWLAEALAMACNTSPEAMSDVVESCESLTPESFERLRSGVPMSATASSTPADDETPERITCYLALIGATRAQPGSNVIYKDYILGVLHGERYLPWVFPSDYMAEDIRQELDAYIGKNTIRMSGGVHFVDRTLVVEVSCGAIVRVPRRSEHLTLLDPRAEKISRGMRPTPWHSIRPSPRVPGLVGSSTRFVSTKPLLPPEYVRNTPSFADGRATDSTLVAMRKKNAAELKQKAAEREKNAAQRRQKAAERRKQNAAR